MYHPVWPDKNGNASVGDPMMGDSDDLNGRDKFCSCAHSLLAHRRTGTCAVVPCMCGWHYDVNGVIREKSTGLTMAEVKERQWRRSKPAYMRELYGKPCHYCGRVSDTVDHLVSRGRGGKNDPANVVPACMICNNLKGGMNEEEFVEYCCQRMWEEYEKEKWIG